VIELFRRKEGVTATEIARLTNWQPHTIRGFISTISRKMKLAIESVRNEQGQRVYRVKYASAPPRSTPPPVWVAAFLRLHERFIRLAVAQ
jgi:hypothetical protein